MFTLHPRDVAPYAILRAEAKTDLLRDDQLAFLAEAVVMRLRTTPALAVVQPIQRAGVVERLRW